MGQIIFKMTKKQEKNIEVYDPKIQYRSVEGKIGDWIEDNSRKAGKNIADFTQPAIKAIGRGTKHTKDFMSEFIPNYLGSVGNLFRAPTTIRKVINYQIRNQGEFDKLNNAQGAGFLGGACLGLATDIVATAYALASASNGDYLPLKILGGSNTINGAYEVGRLPISIRENKGQNSTTKSQEPIIESRKDPEFQKNNK